MRAPNYPSPSFQLEFIQGELLDFLANQNLALSFVSIPEQGVISVLIGIEGWSPQVVSLSAARKGTIRVASNGFILDLAASHNATSDEITEGANSKRELNGTFRNVLEKQGRGEFLRCLNPTPLLQQFKLALRHFLLIKACVSYFGTMLQWTSATDGLRLGWIKFCGRNS